MKRGNKDDHNFAIILYSSKKGGQLYIGEQGRLYSGDSGWNILDINQILSRPPVIYSTATIPLRYIDFPLGKTWINFHIWTLESLTI